MKLDATGTVKSTLSARVGKVAIACSAVQATLSGLLERADASKADSRALLTVKPSADGKQALANAQTLRRLLTTQRALTGMHSLAASAPSEQRADASPATAMLRLSC